MVILGFFSSETDAAAVAFVSAAEHSEDVFAFTTDATVAAHFSVTAPKVIALKKVCVCVCVCYFHWLSMLNCAV